MESDAGGHCQFSRQRRVGWRLAAVLLAGGRRTEFAFERRPEAGRDGSVVDPVSMWVCADSEGAPTRILASTGKGWAMRAVREHFAQHTSHLLGCGVAGVLVVAAIVFSFPILAVFGALMCAVMMIGMVWMMFAMVSKGRH